MRSLAVMVTCLAWLALAVGCTAESSNGPGSRPAVTGNGGSGGEAAGEDGGASGGGSGGSAGAGEPTGGLCPADNVTRACTCQQDGDTLPGRQVCSVSLGWAQCECAEAPETLLPSTVNQGSGSGAVDPAANRSPADFEWERVVPTGGSCKPGRYDGVFDGLYMGGSFVGIPVMGNVSFELGESLDGEFFEVSGGTMEGLALFVYAFQGEIVGSLDCTTGFFEGFMQNCTYTSPGGGPTEFEGPLRADYDRFNNAFVSGVWGVTERDSATGDFYPPPDVQPGVLLPPLPARGGVGNWSATLVP